MRLAAQPPAASAPRSAATLQIGRSPNGFGPGMLSDGTLRLLALTLLAYVPDGDGICLFEVPENGLHSGAVEAVFKAFSAVAQHEDRARAQILTTTHSPVVFDLADPEQLLCFVTTETGATEIVSGADRGAG